MEIQKKRSNPVKVGVVGARGYSGQELCRLLYQHNEVSLDSIFFNKGKSFSLWAECPELERLARSKNKLEPRGLELEEFFHSKETLDIVFLATPNDVSMELADLFLGKGTSVIDLSGIFRLNKVDAKTSESLYLKYYGLKHSKMNRLNDATYGLQPYNKSAFSHPAQGPILIANPGCYVTSILMAILPLVQQGLVDEKSIIVDSKSGASGAGKKMAESLMFSELYGDFYPYKVLNHQHLPEIEMYLDFFSGAESKVIFTPHLLPLFRGLLSTCYLKWSDKVMALCLEEKKSKVSLAYQKQYGEYPLVDWGELNDQRKKISVKAIQQSCMTNIGFECDADHLIVVSVIDNLLKGAASQAIENFNCIYGFPIQESLV